MAIYSVTTANWNNAAFWASVIESTAGHTLDFSGLPAGYSVAIDDVSGMITLDDGTSSFTVGEAGVSGTDANLGGNTALDFFTALTATDGADTVEGTASADTISGGAGDDYVDGGAGADTISGGDGADDLRGGWDDSASNTIYGDAGNDLIFGASGDDFLFGGADQDWILASWGNDFVDGGTGNDLLFGDDGNDTLIGDGGNDTLYGGDDGDTIYAGADADEIIGGHGNDLTYGEGGDDVFRFSDGWGADTVVGGEAGETSGDTLDLSAVTLPLTVVYTGDEAGTVSDGSNIIAFSEIETLILTGRANTVDARADSLGIHVDAGAGDDTIIGGSGGDSLEGGDGADTLWGLGGNDTLLGGQGRNHLYGGDGDDSLVGSASDWGGFTQMRGGAGADTLDGTAGSWDIASYYDATGGVNVDLTDTQAETGSDALGDILIGIEQVDGSNLGDDTIVGDADAHELKGWGGNDVLTLNTTDWGLARGGDGADTIIGGTSADTISGGAGDDRIDAGAGADSLDGGSGHDIVDGGAGHDTLAGGTGDDTLSGGAGNDAFIYTAGDGADTIVDFNTGNTGTLDDGDATNNDFIDLSAFYDDIWELHADQADDGVLNQSNDGVGGVDYSDNTRFLAGDSLTFTGASADAGSFTSENTGVVCFVRGTRILTPFGETRVEDLRVGHRVVTADHGVQKIRWIGSSRVARSPALQPIRIAAGALGQGAPSRTLYVSPQHRLVVRSRIVERMTGAREALVAAKKLVGLHGIRADTRKGHVRYFHILCDAHEIVFANGAPAETLLPGPMARDALGPDAWAELRAVFPDIEDRLEHPCPARGVLTGRRRSVLVRRHRRNRVNLLDT